MRKTIVLLLINIFAYVSYAQNSTIEGYVFEDGNRGYLNEVAVKIFKKDNKQLITSAFTNKDGFFTAQVPAGTTYEISAEKDLFNLEKATLIVKPSDKNKKVFTKIKMFRKPGYLFDVTMAEMMVSGQKEVDAVTGARIEVYNNTTKKTELTFPNHPQPTFKVNFERGNHYSILIRKDGFFSKRLEAFVDVKGCILCFEGVGKVEPGVSDVLTEKNQMGTLLANISLRPIQHNRVEKLNQVSLSNGAQTEASRKELDNLITLIKDNPHLTFELGVHTDARDNDQQNLTLSQQKAESIAQYIYNSNQIQPNQLIAKGYGETQLVNGCSNDVACSNELHAQNKRIEWKVTKSVEDNFLKNRSLAQIIEVEQFNAGLNFDTQEQFVARSGATLPPEVAGDIKSYSSESEKITTTNNQNGAILGQEMERKKFEPNVNQDGVTLAQEMYTNDPYAEVTNATRLVDTNYDEAADREAMKRQPMPTAYKSTVKIAESNRVNRSNNNSEIPSEYEKAAASRKIIVSQPRLGETMVASASSRVNTRTIPNYYTGYKVEFVTALSELPATHEVFNRHGNIAMEQQPNGIYSYMLGDFQDQKVAENFLQEHLLEKYPMASLVFYENGKRGQKVVQKMKKTKPSAAPPR